MKHLSNIFFTVTVLTAIFVVVALIFCIFAALIYPKYFPEPTEPISWSVVEEVGRDGNEVHYRGYFSNGMTVDRYTRMLGNDRIKNCHFEYHPENMFCNEQRRTNNEPTD